MNQATGQLRTTVAVLLPTVTAIVSSVPMLRGPISAGLLVGALSGYVMRSRWALLLAPLAPLAAPGTRPSKGPGPLVLLLGEYGPSARPRRRWNLL